jgi:hypothetical protein
LAKSSLGTIAPTAMRMLVRRIVRSWPAFALQHNVPLEVLRKALLRDGQGRASSPIGPALDLLAED